MFTPYLFCLGFFIVITLLFLLQESMEVERPMSIEDEVVRYGGTDVRVVRNDADNHDPMSVLYDVTFTNRLGQRQHTTCRLMTHAKSYEIQWSQNLNELM